MYHLSTHEQPEKPARTASTHTINPPLDFFGQAQEHALQSGLTHGISYPPGAVGPGCS